MVNDSALGARYLKVPVQDGKPLLDVWMSHGDKVTLPADFLGRRQHRQLPVRHYGQQRFYGVQFHPEVTHTRRGMRMLERFVRDICRMRSAVDPAKIIDDAVERYPSAGWRRQSDPLRRCGLFGDRDAAAPRYRQKPDLRIRGQRSAPERSAAGDEVFGDHFGYRHCSR